MQNAPWEHAAILSTFINYKTSLIPLFYLLFEWPFKTGFNVYEIRIIKWCFKALLKKTEIIEEIFSILIKRSIISQNKRPYGSFPKMLKNPCF